MADRTVSKRSEPRRRRKPKYRPPKVASVKSSLHNEVIDEGPELEDEPMRETFRKTLPEHVTVPTKYVEKKPVP